MSRTAIASLTLRVTLSDEYQGDTGVDVEADLRYGLENGELPEGLTIEVTHVAARAATD